MAEHEMVTTIYEDSLGSRLRPMVYLRPAFCILSGGCTLVERVRRQNPGSAVNLLVREQLENLTRELVPGCGVNEPVPRTGLFVNGRALSVPEAAIRGKDPRVYVSGDTVVAFRTDEEISLDASTSGVSHSTWIACAP